VKSISYSASESSGEDEKLSTGEIFFTILISIGMTILLFYAAPLLVARLLTDSRGLLFNFLDGLVRLVIFILYLLVISLMPDIRRIFQYHGAEHMTVHAFEHGEKLTVKNIKKYTTLHPRCGTSFLMIVMVVSIMLFSIIPQELPFLYKFLSRIILIPLIAGFSLEFLKFSAKWKNNIFMNILIQPGLLLQKLTTREPDEAQLEVALRSLIEVLKLEENNA
jgi:uncharacterized protein YqhQ